MCRKRIARTGYENQGFGLVQFKLALTRPQHITYVKPQQLRRFGLVSKCAPSSSHAHAPVCCDVDRIGGVLHIKGDMISEDGLGAIWNIKNGIYGVHTIDCCSSTDKDGISKLRSYFGLNLYLTMTDYIGSKTYRSKVKSAQDLNCDFENPAQCMWRNYANPSTKGSMNRWLVAEKVDNRDWKNLHINPKITPAMGSHVILSGKASPMSPETVILISHEIPNQSNFGTLKFDYWIINQGYLKVSVIADSPFKHQRHYVLLEKRFSCKQTILCRIMACGDCSAGVLEIPPIDHPFKIMFEAEIPTGSSSAVAIDNIHYIAKISPPAEPAAVTETVVTAERLPRPSDESFEQGEGGDESTKEADEENNTIGEAEEETNSAETEIVKEPDVKLISISQKTGACRTWHCDFRAGSKCNWVTTKKSESTSRFEIKRNPIGSAPNVMVKPTDDHSFLGVEIGGNKASFATIESSKRTPLEKGLKMHVLIKRGTHGSTMTVCFENNTKTKTCKPIAGPSFTVADWKNPKEVIVDIPQGTEKITFIVENRAFSTSGKSAFGIDYVMLTDTGNNPIC
ncbi:unnamed protein product [Soboliphyme baturini]|uniref:MAM domain-containing protein n=1 Tax=Soboliphyme baturini TaxID=241478 RepID=A0A183IT97_9BILA|nr:unnamed protein product [Soboliphyme baturini]